MRLPPPILISMLFPSPRASDGKTEPSKIHSAVSGKNRTLFRFSQFCRIKVAGAS